MNIVFHVPKLILGGAEKQLSYLVLGLKKAGIQSHIVTLYEGGEVWDELVGAKSCVLYSLNRKNRWDFSVVKKLNSYIVDNHIDLIQGWMPPCNTFSMISSLMCNRPAILGIRTSNVRHLEVGGRLYNRIDAYLSHIRSKKIICNSNNGKKYCIEAGFPKDKVVVIPNGINTERFSTLCSDNLCSSKKLKLGMLSRITLVKNHQMAFDACKILQERGYEYELYLYGKGEECIENSLRNYVKRIGIDKNVFFHGWAENVINALSGIDIYLSTSNYEGMSNSIMEAMASGRVIIATDVGDAKAMLNQFGDRAGYIIPTKAPEKLADTICSIRSDPNEARERALLGKKIVHALYSVESMVKEYLKIYQEVVINASAH